MDSRIGDHVSDLFRRNHQAAENTLGKATLRKYSLDRQGTLRHIGSVFEHSCIARHEVRCGKSEHLPEGEIPGHDRERRVQRFVSDIAFASLGGDQLISEEWYAVIGIVLTDPCALLDLSP